MFFNFFTFPSYSTQDLLFHSRCGAEFGETTLNFHVLICIMLEPGLISIGLDGTLTKARVWFVMAATSSVLSPYGLMVTPPSMTALTSLNLPG